MLQRDVLAKYKNERDMPPPVKALGYQLMQANERDFALAESLGWRESDGQIPDSKTEGVMP